MFPLSELWLIFTVVNFYWSNLQVQAVTKVSQTKLDFFNFHNFLPVSQPASFNVEEGDGPLELAVWSVFLRRNRGEERKARSGNERQSFLNKNDNDDGDGEHYVNKFYSDAGGRKNKTGILLFTLPSSYFFVVACCASLFIKIHSSFSSRQLFTISSPFPFYYYGHTLSRRHSVVPRFSSSRSSVGWLIQCRSLLLTTQ